LRAAGVTADLAARDRDYAAVHGAAARGRIPSTEALARERTGDFTGATRAYDSLGLRADALRARGAIVSAGNDTVQRAALCADIEQFVSSRPGTPDARSAIDVADRACGTLPLDVELKVARSASVSGPLIRAVNGFARLDVAGKLDPADRYAYGLALFHLGRHPEARTQLAKVRTREADYTRARLDVADGDKAGARRLLRTLTAAHDTIGASALMLLADLASDNGDDAAARSAYGQVAKRYPTAAVAGRARFRSAMIAFVGGQFRTAAHEWDALAAAHGEDEVAARYWSARAYAAAGDSAAARQRWRAIVVAEPLSYYAGLSGRRLTGKPALPTVGTDTVAPPVGAVVDSALGRAMLLSLLGMDVESRFEVDRVAHGSIVAGGASYDQTLAVGAALARAGESSRAIGFGWRLLARGDSARADRRVYRLIYPLLYGERLVADARAASLDPALVAAVIRQESNFTAKAVSAVGARGLMQVMPAVGRSLAHAHGTWDPAVLDQPDVNLDLGTAHLATFLSQEGGIVERGLAAYNAGPSRVTLWSTKRGVQDPEVFVERIPFAETRDYVRAIVRGRELYAALYGL
jgi:soluble lytic murein transglycosylase